MAPAAPGAGGVGGASTAAVTAPLRVLLLESRTGRDDAGDAAQLSALRDGLRAVGAAVDSPREALPGAKRARRADAATERAPARASHDETDPSHLHAPYSLVVALLSDDGHDAELSRTIRGVLGASRSSRSANRTLVACVRGDARPPPVWQLWLPPFCDLAFVREMRMLWW